MNTPIHTYLFLPAVWWAEGYYLDQKNQKIMVEGTLTVIHEGDMWACESLISIVSEKENSRYRQQEDKDTQLIIPFEAGANHTIWRSSNPSPTRFKGQFVLLEDTILSTALTHNSRINSVESFSKITEKHYHNCGALFEGETKTSSWVLELHKE